ncbi:hypothetical protein L5B97_01820 [Avibacterium sp. 20-15]|uniref:hypothetical protein n=1 Tax=unclassified Avibacterium TaxID=2685287 RepID=UPI00202631AC|nr:MULTISPECIES: hypothetical protein [unclassified Avibacterium]MCW9732233.1 hypothetical protein [Avibacterium sp. 20-15]URL04404.1 hypothetical protein L4F93_00515 [Avibacterium sp. 20-132]
MNLENDFLLNEIFEGRIDIAIFVVDRNYLFVFDDKENFTIDIRPFYKRYLNDGIITKEQYTYAINHYRGGAFTLDKASINKYMSSIKIKPKDIIEMKNFFYRGFDLSFFYKVYLNPMKFHNELNKIKLKIPKFYINLDKNIFFHNYKDRDFEKEQPKNWSSTYSDNFLSLIPIEYKYWVVNNMDFSKI